MLESIGFEGDFPVSRGEKPSLLARIRMPAGDRRLA